ncbi:hypothetical protein K461DRAFT_229557 [Myriangium duriaei CBS 260.36]|uniref:tRNA pseudouridine synthase 1 n=1 Tax=Myriangium duriaei CBS 260.36 TaxID=1168546 RepID=A0A9P4IY76_9PEZI|nr:hypothetical protein K461DRAFT_229557 [Myriangium duriaei CBS 260.36]
MEVENACDQPSGNQEVQSHDSRGGSEHDRKRKRGDDQRGRNGGRGKKRDMGRKEWQREKIDKRERNELEHQKRKQQQENGSTGNRQLDKPSVLPAGFAQEEIDAEDRRPKRKVAVLIGYSGTGYRGMQITLTERTIEGDLFTAFVNAGAISKANANDPKKSSLVRCARTDKGVHAAGNMISLKLIIEDENIVDKINEHLAPQIRVWGIERTIGSFSCYQACDSRWYEYLIPTHALIPPHPSSYLATKIAEFAKEVGDEEELAKRQADVKGFWEEVEEKEIKPVLDGLDDDVRALVTKALFPRWDDSDAADPTGEDIYVRNLADIGDANGQSSNKPKPKQKRNQDGDEDETAEEPEVEAPTESAEDDSATAQLTPEQRESLMTTTRQLKKVYDAARRRYRISPSRVELLQAALSTYTGTRNYHNYTIQKTFNDPSAKRVIKSFVANPSPILIDGTEWLSLKVHGQSFMMHQIRKMVSMATLLVRCGADAPLRITQSYGKDRWSIPKVPGLGLLLERPVFDSYNNTQAAKFGKEKLDFGKYEDKIEEFKRESIYKRIYEEEASANTFHQFFNHIDNYQQPHFLYLTSKGHEATLAPRRNLGGNNKVAADAKETAAAEETKVDGNEVTAQPVVAESA